MTPEKISSSAVSVGQRAPDFTLESDTGGPVTLGAHRGSPIVLYFYPRDNTSGCTAEACDFRDRLDRIAAAGAVVLGVSRDSLRSHARFREKHALGFPLLSDPEAEVHQLYGAWGEKKMYGRTSVGPIRTTVLIDADGVIRQLWRKVRVKGHVEAVIEALSDL